MNTKQELDTMIAEAEADLEHGECGKCTPGAWQRRVVWLMKQERERERLAAWVLEFGPDGLNMPGALAGAWPHEPIRR